MNRLLMNNTVSLLYNASKKKYFRKDIKNKTRTI